MVTVRGRWAAGWLSIRSFTVSGSRFSFHGCRIGWLDNDLHGFRSNTFMTISLKAASPAVPDHVGEKLKQVTRPKPENLGQQEDEW